MNNDEHSVHSKSTTKLWNPTKLRPSSQTVFPQRAPGVLRIQQTPDRVSAEAPLFPTISHSHTLINLPFISSYTLHTAVFNIPSNMLPSPTEQCDGTNGSHAACIQTQGILCFIQPLTANAREIGLSQHTGRKLSPFNTQHTISTLTAHYQHTDSTLSAH